MFHKENGIQQNVSNLIRTTNLMGTPFLNILFHPLFGEAKAKAEKGVKRLEMLKSLTFILILFGEVKQTNI